MESKTRARVELSTLEKVHKLPLPSPPPTFRHSLERAKLSTSVGKTEHFFYIWALPNYAPSHHHTLPSIFQEKQPTSIHSSTKVTHSHSFFNKSGPLSHIFQGKQPTPTHFRQKRHTLPIFQPKRPTPTQFSRKTTCSHRFFDKYVHLPVISDGKRSTPTQFQQLTPSHPFFNKFDPLPLIFQQKRPTPTILNLFPTDLPPKQLVFTSFPTITDFPSPLPLMH